MKIFWKTFIGMRCFISLVSTLLQLNVQTPLTITCSQSSQLQNP